MTTSKNVTTQADSLLTGFDFDTCARGCGQQRKQQIANIKSDTESTTAAYNLLILNISSGGFRGGPSRLRPPPFGTGTEAVTHAHVSKC